MIRNKTLTILSGLCQTLTFFDRDLETSNRSVSRQSLNCPLSETKLVQSI